MLFKRTAFKRSKAPLTKVETLTVLVNETLVCKYVVYLCVSLVWWRLGFVDTCHFKCCNMCLLAVRCVSCICLVISQSVVCPLFSVIVHFIVLR